MVSGRPGLDHVGTDTESWRLLVAILAWFLLAWCTLMLIVWVPRQLATDMSRRVWPVRART
jgi:hypothetical protein